jgi:hypothetical protein
MLTRGRLDAGCTSRRTKLRPSVKKKNVGGLNAPCSSLIHKRTKKFGREKIIQVCNVHLYVHI